MGVVVNQSIKNVIITSLGFGIGAINTLFLFTKFMDKEYYGLVSYIFSASNILWPLIAFGVHNALVKFYSSYEKKEERHAFLGTLLVFPLCIALVIGTVGSIAYGQLLDFFGAKNEIVRPYVWTIYVLAIALTYFELFFGWAKVKLKSVFGTVLKEVFVRGCIMILLWLVYLELLTPHQFIYGVVAAYICRLLIMMVYAMRLHTFRFVFAVPTNFGAVLKYSFLILIAGSVASLLLDLDKTMIERYMPIENVAKYSLCAYIASVIIMPSRAMHQITYPLTAKLMNTRDMVALKELYRKSSLSLLVVSGLLFILIVCNVHQLFELIPDEYELFITIVFFIGMAKLLDNLLGNTNAILFNSDYYRLVLYIGLGMAILSFLLNMICIPIYGIEGAAMATFLAICCYNVSKLWIVWSKFTIHPFAIGTVFMIGVIPICIASFYFWDFPFHPMINIVLKSVLIGISYLVIIYLLKISTDINQIIKKVLKLRV